MLWSATIALHIYDCVCHFEHIFRWFFVRHGFVDKRIIGYFDFRLRLRQSYHKCIDEMLVINVSLMNGQTIISFTEAHQHSLQRKFSVSHNSVDFGRMSNAWKKTQFVISRDWLKSSISPVEVISVRLVQGFIWACWSVWVSIATVDSVKFIVNLQQTFRQYKSHIIIDKALICDLLMCRITHRVEFPCSLTVNNQIR